MSQNQVRVLETKLTNQFSRQIDELKDIEPEDEPADLPTFVNSRMRIQQPFENFPNVSKLPYSTVQEEHQILRE